MSLRHLFLFAKSEKTRILLEESRSNWRTTDSGLNIPLSNTATIPSTHGNAQKIPLSIKVGVVDVSGNPQPCLLLPRSSTGSKTPLRLSNSIGLIDSGYRGEVIACVDNISDAPVTINEGASYFQICAGDFAPFAKITIVDNENELPSALDDRGAGGFGSTGK